MAVNLPPQYHDAEARYKKAQTPEDKLVALKEMWVILPKHKASEKVQAELKTKISELTDRIEQVKSAPKKAPPGTFSFPRQGAGQVVFIGPPNAGKSSLLARLTKATPAIAPYPFTTREPVPGMMDYEDVRVQLIDLPPVTADHYEPFITDITRGADAAHPVPRPGRRRWPGRDAGRDRTPEAGSPRTGAVRRWAAGRSGHPRPADPARRDQMRRGNERDHGWSSLATPSVALSRSMSSRLSEAMGSRNCGERFILRSGSCGCIRSSRASWPIGRTPSRRSSAVRSRNWPGRFIATWKTRSNRRGSGAAEPSTARRWAASTCCSDKDVVELHT